MAIHLTHQERLGIANNTELVGRLVLADIIGVVHERTGTTAALWRRRIEEIEARTGLPATAQVLLFAVSSKEEIEYYQEIVDRLKNRDELPAEKQSCHFLTESSRRWRAD